ncbi:hypothetical protein WJX74_002804 [Apatococcus lobatus]|uniref:Uncharacterized protein n=1 Tax=Apatococcus lobatus TaxID=904363 RepID=A0AAW1RRZ7_9CHLO
MWVSALQWSARDSPTRFAGHPEDMLMSMVQLGGEDAQGSVDQDTLDGLELCMAHELAWVLELPVLPAGQMAQGPAPEAASTVSSRALHSSPSSQLSGNSAEISLRSCWVAPTTDRNAHLQLQESSTELSGCQLLHPAAHTVVNRPTHHGERPVDAARMTGSGSSLASSMLFQEVRRHWSATVGAKWPSPCARMKALVVSGRSTIACDIHSRFDQAASLQCQLSEEIVQSAHE